MFRGSLNKIKIYITIITVVEIISCIICAVRIWSDVENFMWLEIVTNISVSWWGVIVLIVGVCSAWLTGLLGYAIGEIVERVISIDKKLYKDNDNNRQKYFLNNLNNAGNQAVKIERVNINNTQYNGRANKTIVRSENDMEVLYQFAKENIEKKLYKIAYNALVQIKGYKNSEELIEEIIDKINN